MILSAAKITCRLCGGNSELLWRHAVMDKYYVGYSECAACGSLQTDEPFWLDEAYRDVGTGFDTGACQRSVDTALLVSTLLEQVDLPREAACLDYGAGMGLFARLMRDRGWDFHAHEKYTQPFYMDRFQAAPGDRAWELVTAFEVFEHLPFPGETLGAILPRAGRYVLFTTELWKGQGRDWNYLSPSQGHHVFFYTRKALEMMGARHGFDFHDLGFAKCFARPSERARLAAIAWPSFGQAVIDSFLRHQKEAYRYALRDQERMLDKSKV